MTLLTPLGLLGLLGVVVLIIIYIIKPNFQQKFISSTHIWKLSLKYKKKRIPTSKLRNFFLILCQILFLTTCAFILAQPNKVLQTAMEEPEVILIIDSSASMRTESEDMTRFERAIEEAILKAEETLKASGFVTVIMADESPEFVLQQRMTGNAYRLELPKQLRAFIGTEDVECSYSTSDIEGALALCQPIFDENPNAKIHLYSDNEYEDLPEFIVNEREKLIDYNQEMNFAVLDAKTQLLENKYNFFIDVAAYGKDVHLKPFNLVVEVQGANAMDSTQDGEKITYSQLISCNDGETATVLFLNEDLYQQNRELYDSYAHYIYSIKSTEDVVTYKSVKISLQDATTEEVLEDSLVEDNVFYLYDGMKEVIRIQYASTLVNRFWPAAIRELRNIVGNRWEIQFTEVKQGDPVATDGYDLYIFEQGLPEVLPEDGVLWLIAPPEMPANMGVTLIQSHVIRDKNGNPTSEYLQSDVFHPIMNNIDAGDISVARFTEMMFDSSFEPLVYMKEYPVVAVRNDDTLKMVVSGFDLHHTNLSLLLEFPMLVYNMFEYFFPGTLMKNAYNVGDTVQLNAMSEALKLYAEDLKSDGDENLLATYTTFPASFIANTPGKYILKQENFVRDEITQYFFVRMAREESNIFSLIEEPLNVPFVDVDMSEFLEDFLFYLALLLVSVAFIEWSLRNHGSV